MYLEALPPAFPSLYLPDTKGICKPSSYSPFSNCHFSLTHESRSRFHPFIPSRFLSQFYLEWHALYHLQPTQLTEVPGWGTHKPLLPKVKMPKQQNICKLSYTVHSVPTLPAVTLYMFFTLNQAFE